MRVTINFHQDGTTTTHAGRVVKTYETTLHGFTIAMVTVVCDDGRTRHVMATDATEIPSRRLVRVQRDGRATDEVFTGTTADFVEAFGVPVALAIESNGTATDGTTTVEWSPEEVPTWHHVGTRNGRQIMECTAHGEFAYTLGTAYFRENQDRCPKCEAFGLEPVRRVDLEGAPF